MSTHTTSKRKSNKATYDENHERILTILQKHMEGLARKEILEKMQQVYGTKVYPRILRKHLKAFGTQLRFEGHLIFWEPNYQRLKVIKNLIDDLYSKFLRAEINPEAVLSTYTTIIIPEKVVQGIKLHLCLIPLALMDADPKKQWDDLRQGLITARSLPNE